MRMPNKKTSEKIKRLSLQAEENSDNVLLKPKIFLILFLLLVSIIIISSYVYYNPQITGYVPICDNDGVCEAGEDTFNCPADCHACGDSACSVPYEYSCGNKKCPGDCGTCSTPLAISITSPANGAYVSSPVTVTGTSTNANEITLTLNGGSSLAVCDGAVGICNNWNYLLSLSVGTNTIKATAYNGGVEGDGVLLPVFTTRTVYYDPILPSISISYPQNSSSYSSSPITVNGTANDNLNLNKVEVKVNGGSWQLATGKTSWTSSVALITGPNVIEARATDAAGNTQTTSVNVSFGPPQPPDTPTNLIATPQSQTQINLNWNDVANEQGYFIERNSSGGAFATIAVTGANEVSYPDSGLTSNVAYSYRIKAYNTAGNSSYSNIATAITPIFQSPTVTLLSPSDNAIQKSPLSFQCGAVSTSMIKNISLEGGWGSGWHVDQTISCPVDGGSCTINFPPTIISVDGTYEWNCYACTFQASCGSAAANKVIIIDTTNPIVSFIEPTDPDNASISRNWTTITVSVVEPNEANITFNLYDSNSLLINSTTFTTLDRSIFFTNLSYGNYSYDVVVIDKAVNRGSTERRRLKVQASVVIPGAPNITFISPTPDNLKSQYETNVTINVSVADNASEIKNCTLKWNNLNLSMVQVGSGLNTTCYLERNYLLTGSYVYFVSATNLQNITGFSEERLVQILSEEPNLITEPTLDLNIEIDSKSKTAFVNESILSLIQIGTGILEPVNVRLNYIIMDENEMPFYEEYEDVEVKEGVVINKWLTAPPEKGDYKLQVVVDYEDQEQISEDTFSVDSRVLNLKLNVWKILLILVIVAAIIFGLRLLSPITTLYQEKKLEKAKKNSSNND